MISSFNPVTIIKGTFLEIIQDFGSIVYHLIEESPETVLAAFEAYSDELEAAIERCNPDNLVAAETIIRIQKEKVNDRHKT